LVLVKATATAGTLLYNAWLATQWGGALDPFVIPYAITLIGGLACAVPYFRAMSGREVESRRGRDAAY
jgi:hypothetical protein